MRQSLKSNQTGTSRRLPIIPFVFMWTCMLSPIFAQASIIVPLKSDSPPQIDGQLNDAIWQQAQAYKQFMTYEPVSGQPGSEKTVAYAAYDTENLYFAFRCEDTQADI